MLHAYQQAVSLRVFNEAAPRAAISRPLSGRRGTQRCWHISTPYLHAGSTKRRPTHRHSRPLLGRRGSQSCIPISTPYLYACLTKRRPTCRYQPPLAGAQRHAALHAHQHAVTLRGLYETAPHAPLAALSRPPLLGRRGMQCCMPISTAYLYACVTRRRPASLFSVVALPCAGCVICGYALI